MEKNDNLIFMESERSDACYCIQP